jgi:glycosyltransferase involved in cell wall biosynthesis
MPLADTEMNRAKEPLKIKEYMAAGLPIVASPVGHNLRVVTDGETGFFAASSQEWEARLTELASDANLRAELGRAGRNLVVERYDLPRLLQELADLFHRLAVRRERTDHMGADAGARAV